MRTPSWRCWCWSLLCITFLSCLSLSSSSSAPPHHNILSAWVQREPSPRPHIEGAVGVIQGRLYTYAGFEKRSGGTLLVSDKLDVYDPETDGWEVAAPGPLAISHCQGATDGQRYLWFAGGFVGNHPGNATNQCWRFDAEEGVWEEGPSLPFEVASSALAYDPNEQELHLFGGLLADRDTNSEDHLVLDVSNASSWGEDSWSIAEDPVLDARNHFQAVFLQNKLYGVGGQHGHDENPIDLTTMDSFLTETATWGEEESLPSARSHAESATVVVNGHILVAGGRSNVNDMLRTNTIFEFDPSDCDSPSCWHNIAGLPYEAADAMTAFFRPNTTIPFNNAQVTGDFLFLNSARIGRLVPHTWVARVCLKNEADYDEDEAVTCDFERGLIVVDSSSSSTSEDGEESSAVDSAASSLYSLLLVRL
ncbi:Kelch repeat protein [Balamuthia mandrillaris]